MVKARRREEGELSTQVLAFFKAHNIFAWRMPVGPVIHRRGKGENVKEFWKKNPLKGFPDWAGVLRRKHRGVLFVIELKSSTGGLEPEQMSWLLDLQGSGVACAVCRSIEEVEAALRAWGEIV